MKYKKSFLVLTTVAALAVSSFMVGCGNDKDKDKTDNGTKQVTEVKPQLPDQNQYPMNLVWSNGEGSWAGRIILNGDGSFTGSYNHINTFDKANDHPRGSKDVSTYKGKFTDIKKVNDYTYSMKVESLETERKAGESWVEDGYKINAVGARGLDVGNEVLFLVPQIPMSNVASDLINAGYWLLGDKKPATLEHYAIYNSSTNNRSAFFTEEVFKGNADKEKDKTVDQTPPVQQNNVPAPTPKKEPAKITKLDAVGRITGEGITIRSAPSTSGKALGYLSKGVLVDVSERYVCDDPNAAVLDADTQTWIINGQKVTIYKGHALSIINEKNGQYRCDLTYDNKYYTVYILMSSVRRITGDIWYKIHDSNSGKTGYVFGDYVNVN